MAPSYHAAFAAGKPAFINTSARSWSRAKGRRSPGARWRVGLWRCRARTSITARAGMPRFEVIDELDGAIARTSLRCTMGVGAGDARRLPGLLDSARLDRDVEVAGGHQYGGSIAPLAFSPCPKLLLNTMPKWPPGSCDAGMRPYPTTAWRTW